MSRMSEILSLMSILNLRISITNFKAYGLTFRRKKNRDFIFEIVRKIMQNSFLNKNDLKKAFNTKVKSY